MNICAFDVDLNRIYGMDNSGAVLFNATPLMGEVHIALDPSVDVALFEIASPVSFTRMSGNSKVTHQLAKWALWNVATIANAKTSRRGQRILVAPSDVWTQGFSLAQRHKLAGCTAKNKDLRECQAMIWFYHKNPKAWVTLPEYLASSTFITKKDDHAASSDN